MLSPMLSEVLKTRMRAVAANSVATALLLSLLFHFMVFGVLEIGRHFGWWKHSLLSSKFIARQTPPFAVNLPQRQGQTNPAAMDIPMVFVEVDPAQASPEPPKESKFYSARNSQAANPDISVEKNIPKITGEQEKVVKTVTKPRTQPEPLVPSAPMQPETKTHETTADSTPKPESRPPVKAGDVEEGKPTKEQVASAEPVTAPAAEPQPPARRRPRRLGDVAQAQAQTGLAGEKMKQDGGTRRYSLEASMDVRATPFGTYDNAIIAAIQQHWYDLLDQRDFVRNYSGKVVLVFRLNSNGSVTEMKVLQNEVNELLALICQRAVQEPAPFAPWPSDMRRLVGAEFREVRFTFHYN